MTRERSPSDQRRYPSNTHPTMATSVRMRMTMFNRRSLGVSVGDSAAFCPYLPPLVVTVGNAAIPQDEVSKPGFGSLKESLSVVCATYTVRLQSIAKNPSLTRHLQETAAITRKVEHALSRVNGLEEYLNSRPSDREELNRRFDVIQYVPISPIVLSAGFLSVSLRSSKDACGLLL